MARLLSGKVKVTSPTGVSTDRYQYLKLEEAEPNLGVPDQSGKVLASSSDGTRSWVSAPSPTAIDGVTIREEGSIVGTAGSVQDINFVGPGVVATASGVGATITIAGSSSRHILPVLTRNAQAQTDAYSASTMVTIYAGINTVIGRSSNINVTENAFVPLRQTVGITTQSLIQTFFNTVVA